MSLEAFLRKNGSGFLPEEEHLFQGDENCSQGPSTRQALSRES